MKTDALVLIGDERERQQASEGWSKEHDDHYSNNELARAAACYAMPESFRGLGVRTTWPWPNGWWKPTPGERIRELVKAGALIVAEIERLQRLGPGTPISGKEAEGIAHAVARDR